MWVNEYSEGQFDRSTSDAGHPNNPGLNTTNAVETVALPTDCFAVRGVWFQQGTINRRLEYRQNITEDYSNSSSTNGQANYEPYYYFRGNNLVLRPIPGFTSTNGPLVVEYTAYPSLLVFGGDIMASGISPLFKELIVMYIVCKAKLKDDLSNGGNTRVPAQQQFGELFKNFRHQISERSKAPQYVTPYEPV